MPDTGEGTLRVNLNFLGTPMEMDHVDRILDGHDHSGEHEYRMVKCVLDLEPKHLPREVLERYVEISSAENYIGVFPVTDMIFERLLLPLKSAKRCFSLGEYLATIELSAHVAEMLAILVWQMTEVRLNQSALDDTVEKELLGRTFENPGQEQRIKVLRGFGLLQDAETRRLDELRLVRKKYFHLWSGEVHFPCKPHEVLILIPPYSIISFQRSSVMRTPLTTGLVVAALLPLAGAQFWARQSSVEPAPSRIDWATDEVGEQSLFTLERNAEIGRSMAAYERQRQLSFIGERNAEIEINYVAYEARRSREFADARNAEIDASLELVAFTAVRNQEIEVIEARSHAERLRELAEAANGEISASLERVAFNAARNAEIEAASLLSAAERLKEFAEARNAEIKTGMAATRAAHERQLIATGAFRSSLIETGSLAECRYEPRAESKPPSSKLKRSQGQ